MDARAIAERLGVPEEAVRAVQRHGFLLRLDLTDAEIRERLWRAHARLLGGDAPQEPLPIHSSPPS
jgi:hypothetical protein